MKVSLNYLKQFLDFDLPKTNELAEAIGSRLGALEAPPQDLGAMYDNVVVVKVVDCQKIEASDHLNYCLIDDGGKVKDIKRDERNLISVVCGANNVKSGIFAAWLPPGSILPASYFTDKLTLELRQINGYDSYGMLASPKELAITDNHDGILIIDQKVKPGDNLAEIYQLNDQVIDIENKMFTHRPDCFGLIGLAREVAGIFNHQFRSPSNYLNLPDLANISNAPIIKIDNQITDLVPRFSLVLLTDVQVKDSPILIQSQLSRMGIRPVNNIVDLTNLIMLETGQPLHAYDFDKLLRLAGGSQLTMSVLLTKQSDKLKLINNKEVTLKEGSIGIAINDQLIGLGGVMGGQNTEVDEQTKAILIEAACFNMGSIRRTSMELGIFSEAVTRFTKNQSPLQTTRVLAYSLDKFKQIIDGCQVGSNIIDDVHLSEEVIDRDSIHPELKVSSSLINDRLGTSLTAEQMASTLENVEFDVDINAEELNIRAPFWRTDITIAEDIVEEIGRLYGYDNIQPVALTRPLLATKINQNLALKTNIRNILSAIGANELLTYSFISDRLIKLVDQSVDKAFELTNSLSPELRYYRLSVIPSLLTKVRPNLKAGYDKFALFEIGTYHVNGLFNPDEPDLPAEFSCLAFVYTAKKPAKSAAYFQAKNYLSFVLEKLNIKSVNFIPLNQVNQLNDHLVELAKPFDLNRSALVLVDSDQLGIVGEFKPKVYSQLKISRYTAGFEINIDKLKNYQTEKKYIELAKYPFVKQDITLKVPASLTYLMLYNFLKDKLKELVETTSSYSLTPISIYQPDLTSDFKNYTFHFKITDYKRTLKDEEVNHLLDLLAQAASQQFKAVRI